jgi:anti-sigma factor RsiW
VKTNLTCETCEPELTAYRDRALHPAVARAMEAHLDSCRSCRAKLRAYDEIASRLAELSTIEAPAWLEARVLHAVTGRARARRIVSRGLAAAGAFSFALTIGLVAALPGLARQWGLPDPTTWPLVAVRAVLDGVVALTKGAALEAAIWEPVARQLFSAVQTLEAVPRALWITLQTTEAQGALLVTVTLGVALYFVLRPSRTREGGVGHACLSL